MAINNRILLNDTGTGSIKSNTTTTNNKNNTTSNSGLFSKINTLFDNSKLNGNISLNSNNIGTGLVTGTRTNTDNTKLNENSRATKSLTSQLDTIKTLSDIGFDQGKKVTYDPISNTVSGTGRDNEGNVVLTNNKAGQETSGDMLYGLKYKDEIAALADKLNNQKDSGSDGDKGSSYYDDLMAAFMKQNEDSRQAAIDAILSNLDAVKGTYKNQIQSIINEYQDLIDQNEVAKDRARRTIRENQANRGQLDSGMGRQEQLEMNIGYDNATSNLKSARESAINEIMSLIAQAESEANTNKATINNNYNNALLEYQLAMQQ